MIDEWWLMSDDWLFRINSLELIDSSGLGVYDVSMRISW